jgi:hypothetical protein
VHIVFPLTVPGSYAQILLIPGEQPLPSIYCSLLPIAGTVHREESVPCTFVRVEFVGLAVTLQFFLYLRYLCRIRVGIIGAKEAQQWAGQVCSHVKGCNGTGRGQLVCRGHHASSITVNRGIQARDIAGNKVHLASAGAIAYDPDLAVGVRLRAQIIDRSLNVAYATGVRNASSGADGSGSIVAATTRSLPVMEVWANGCVAIVCELASYLFG